MSNGRYYLPRFIYTGLLLLLLSARAFPQAPSVIQAEIDSLLTQLAHAGPDTSRVMLLHSIALFYQQRDPKKAEAYIDQSMQLADKLKWDKGLAHSYMVKGELRSDAGKVEEAETLYQTGMAIAEKTDDKNLISTALNNLGNLYSTRSDWVNAMESYTKSLQIGEEVNNKNLIATSLVNIGVLYSRQGNHDKSRSYKLKALKIFNATRDWDKAALSINGIAHEYYNEGNIEKAKEYQFKALHIYQKINNKTGIAILYSQIAILFEPDYPKIIAYQLLSKQIWDEINPTHYNAMVNLGSLGYSYLNMITSGQYLKLADTSSIPRSKEKLLALAEGYIQQALKQAQDMKNKEFESYFYGILAEVNDEQGNYKNAYQHFRTFYEQNDSLYSQEMKNKISNIEGERAISLKDKEIELVNLRLKQQWMYAITIILVVISVLSYYLNRYRLRQLKLRNEFEQQKSEQTEQQLILQNRITESELKAIRSQMNPHFIFNVLNNIESYVLDNEPETASRLIQKFAKLNRLILENSSQSLVPVHKEWMALMIYTELEAVRFNNQFRYRFEADKELDMERLLIPPMLVQPLVENAIHHGLRNAGRSNNLLLIQLQQDEDHLIFIINDNGVGFKSSADEKKHVVSYKEKSMGLDSVKERIEIINSLSPVSQALFSITDKEDYGESGTICVLKLPKIFAAT